MRPDDRGSVDAPRADRSGAESAPGGGVLVRLTWMVFGPTLLVVSIFGILATPRWTFGRNDAVLALAAALSVGFRFWDVRAFHGDTASGEPATMSVFRRYAVGMTLVVCACWVAAQSVHL